MRSPRIPQGLSKAGSMVQAKAAPQGTTDLIYTWPRKTTRTLKKSAAIQVPRCEKLLHSVRLITPLYAHDDC